MKKVFKMAALAVVVLGLATACKQKAAEPEEIIDTTPIEEVAEEIEEVAEDIIVEEPVKKATKPVVKKEDPLAKKEVNSKPAAEAVSNTPNLKEQKQMKESSASQKVTKENNLDSKKK